jgi:hypothetical protein
MPRMPQLRNIRHETLARELVISLRTGGTHGQAYTRSGYRATGAAADVCVSKLLSLAKNGISQRVQELMAGGAKRAEVTVASLLDELEQARVGATSAEQFAAATSAVIAKAKLSGLMTDRLEIGPAGAFAPCQTVEDIADQVVRDMDPQEAVTMVGELLVLLEERAANMATTIAPTLAARPGNETALALKALRPSRRR